MLKVYLDGAGTFNERQKKSLKQNSICFAILIVLDNILLLSKESVIKSSLEVAGIVTFATMDLMNERENQTNIKSKIKN